MTVCPRSPSALQALLNSSQKYHDAMDNFKDYGVEVSDVKIVLPQMMKQKDKAVAGLTSGIEGLFKKYKVSPRAVAMTNMHSLCCQVFHTPILPFPFARSGTCTRVSPLMQVSYVKGWGSFSGPNDIDVALLDGGNQTVSGKNIIIATGSEVTPLPNIPIDEER